jgi:eukaryotic-like serine/threonine-protein kinase
MKVCPNCQAKYPDDANFCPQETCATPEGPRRLDIIAEAPARPRYDLENEMGGSRSGEVFTAKDTQTGATVAYKRIARAALPTPAIVDRAQRELKQLSRAQNAHLARVLDFGKDAEGRVFVVSELAQGQPLDRMVAATGPLPLDRVKRVVAQIGEALLEGQKVGVVHHDLSAKNVLVDEGDAVKLINFVAPVPVSDTVFGVPEYLSPEQAEGKLVDQRSNTYSLGAIMTLMLTGQPPVSGSDVASTLATIKNGEVVPPSRAVPGLTPEVDRVVLKAMDKSPNRRPLTMRQFLTDVGGLVAMGAGTAAAGGVGFAKTMMFTGGSPDVQKLVNQALAARAEANGATAGQGVVAMDPNAGQATPPPQAPMAMPPAPAASPQQVTPPPQANEPSLGPRRSHGAAIAATMVAMPAANARMPGASQAASGASPADLDRAMSTPPPVAATPPPGGPAPGTAAAGAPTPKQAAGGTFRETLWFKKGDVDQMVAEARARVEAARGKGAAPPEEVVAVAAGEAPPEDVRPLEDRYVDDGSVTAEDRKKFSLRSGGTATAMPIAGRMPGERMSESEMVGEIGKGKRAAIIGVAIALVVVLGAIVVMRHKGAAKSAVAVPAPAVAEPAPPPVEAPPPPAAAPPAPSEKAPPAAKSAAAKAADDGGAAKAKAASKKHVATKKAKSSKKHR